VKKQIATLVEESDPTRRSSWWWRKSHVALEGHFVLDGDPPLRNVVKGHADLVLRTGLREPRPHGSARETKRD
jgi:hypothetical protein